jgi:hypothetical protein
MQAGAVGFFQKPVEDDELLLAVRKALDIARGGVGFSNRIRCSCGSKRTSVYVEHPCN